MRTFLAIFIIFTVFCANAQENPGNYKKRVLENIELDIISSFYTQDGDHAAVTGGLGTESLTDLASTITISIPLNDNDIISIDASVSAYTSASSSNLDPFDKSGASEEEDEDEFEDKKAFSSLPLSWKPTGVDSKGSPWISSSGASKSDVWTSFSLSYSHSSNDRNNIISGNISTATEYDYFSIGFGGGYTRLLHQKNTEIGIYASVYLDQWRPRYPTELDSYLETGSNLNSGYFTDVPVLDQNGTPIDKNGTDVWDPVFSTLIKDKARNTFALSTNFSQILSKKIQFIINAELVLQKGWLSNPMQRVYFSDRPNFYIGNGTSIANYTSPANRDVFHLADDIERLPEKRLKIPIGIRLNYYLSERVTLRSYYRYYYDDWDVNSHTANLEIPVKISDQFTIYPAFRFYNQTAAEYFAPYNQLQSTQKYYTSDYDLSKFNARQYSLGLSYTDIFTKNNIWKFGLKKAELQYSYYKRNTGLTAGIVSAGVSFVMDK